MSRSAGKALWIVVALLLLVAVVGALAALLMLDGGGPPAGRKILELDLTRPYPEYVPEDPFAKAFGFDLLLLREVVETLERAAEDESVVALVARVGSAPVGLATLQELRAAVRRFADSGKETLAWADTFGEWGPGNGAYFLATAFDRVDLQPSGDIGLTGLLYETSFLRGTFDKLGLEPRMDQRHEYKSAMNSLTETRHTPAHAEALAAVLDSQFSQIVRGVAAGRGLAEERVRELFDRGPYLGAEAREAGLVDGLAYWDEVLAGLEERHGEDAALTPLDEYARRRRGARGAGGGREVALIYGVGGVERGESGYDPLTGGVHMGSDTVAQAFRDAVEDEAVEAILFRVSSPGGSYVASDTIWRETVRAREAGKPVVVSMGDVAGSGGYFVAMAADAIVAQPGTITGSIGVYGGKILSRGFWEKLGVTWDDVASGERAAMWSSLHDFTPDGWDRLGASLDRIYDDFTDKVASGRGLTRREVRAAARGRIWTGEDAARLGLVDKLGGFPTALAEIRERIGAAEDEPLRLAPFPRPRSPFELLFERRSWIGGELPEGLRRTLAAADTLARRLGLLEPAEAAAGPLAMPPIETLR